MTGTTTMTATIYIWSEIGHTPLTGRKGSYCDELCKVDVEVSGPEEARAKTAELIRLTRHAYRGGYDIPDYWNQNQRSGYVGWIEANS